MEESDGKLCCNLCHYNCEIKNGSFGACGVRGNKGGKGIIPFYGFITALAIDPIEKKPLYRFKPGSKILSLGFAGCNLRCPFCQNWHISQNTDIADFESDLGGRRKTGRGVVSGKWMQPQEIVNAALANHSPSIAYTYSEPLVHAEYILDCMLIAKKNNIDNVLVTNGCMNQSAAKEILELTSAANVDLKCFSADTYKNVLGGDLQTVLDFIKLCFEMKVHLEITTLVVPELNDSVKELNDIADFIASVDKDIPWHLTAYHPDYRWNAAPTNPQFLREMAKEAGKKLTSVYTGNI